jgi:hypothetical protein
MLDFLYIHSLDKKILSWAPFCSGFEKINFNGKEEIHKRFFLSLRIALKRKVCETSRTFFWPQLPSFLPNENGRSEGTFNIDLKIDSQRQLCREPNMIPGRGRGMGMAGRGLKNYPLFSLKAITPRYKICRLYF